MPCLDSFDRAFRAYARQCAPDERELAFFLGGTPLHGTETPKGHGYTHGSLLIEASHELDRLNITLVQSMRAQELDAKAVFASYADEHGLDMDGFVEMARSLGQDRTCIQRLYKGTCSEPGLAR